MRKRYLGIFSVILTVLCWTAKASLITYTLSGNGNGTFDGESFFDAPFTIASTADTANITENNPIGQIQDFFSVPDVTATVSVSGIGIGTFTSPTETFDNQYGAVGITSLDEDLDILDVRNDEFISYDLSTSLGPVTGAAAFNEGFNFSTTDGDFSLASVFYNTVTFQAEIVPEPSVFALLGVAILLFIIWQRFSRPICHHNS